MNEPTPESIAQNIVFEYRLRWAPNPYRHEPARILFVKAVHEEAARAIATDHIERTEGRSITIFDCKLYKKPSGGVVTS